MWCEGGHNAIHQTPRYYKVPTQTGELGKMGRHFPVREKTGNFEQTGKLEISDKILEMLFVIFLVIFK